MDASEAFASLFRGFSQRHGRYDISSRADSGKMAGRARTVDEEPVLACYQAHLKGEYGIGIIPLTEDNLCYFAAIDVDKYNLSHREVAEKAKGLPLVITESKSGGVHLWLFIKDGAPASLVVSVIKTWAGELGFGGCEIFPKQTERSRPEDIGNWINLPYFGDSRWCVLPDGKRLSLEEFLDHVYGNEKTAGRRVTAEFLESARATIEHVPPGQKGASKEDFEDGPPCFQTMLEKGIPEGTRNDSFFNFAVYLMRKYDDPDVVKRKLYEVDKTFEIGLPNKEIDISVGSAAKKEYGYRCNQAPLKDFCQRKKCVRRQFGVGQGERATLDFKVEIGGMTKILTDPPMWAFNVNGVRVLAKNTRTLLNQNLFKELLVDAVSVIVPALPQDKFDNMVQQWLDQSDEVEVPQDLAPVMLLIASIAEFISERRSEHRDRIASGNVWVSKENVAWFHANDLKKFLSARKQDGDLRELTHVLQTKYGLDKKNTTVSNKSMVLWCLPMESLDASEVTLEQPAQEAPF